jgi:hypothetical protein
MTKEDQKYYEDYFDLFTTEGWKQFISEIEESISRFTFDVVGDEKDLFLAKGQLLILNNTKNFEDRIRSNYDSVTEELLDD